VLTRVGDQNTHWSYLCLESILVYHTLKAPLLLSNYFQQYGQKKSAMQWSSCQLQLVIKGSGACNKINISLDVEYLKVHNHTGIWYLMRQSRLQQVLI